MWQGSAPPFLGEMDQVSGLGCPSPAPGWLQQPPCSRNPWGWALQTCSLSTWAGSDLEPQKVEDLCPCLRWMGAHQRWGSV